MTVQRALTERELDAYWSLRNAGRYQEANEYAQMRKSEIHATAESIRADVRQARREAFEHAAELPGVE